MKLLLEKPLWVYFMLLTAMKLLLSIIRKGK